MTDATFTFRVDDALKLEFAQAAKSCDRSSAQLLRDFMQEFVREQETAEHDTWFQAQVQAGQVSADAGRLLPAADVEARFAAKRAAARRRSGAAG